MILDELFELFLTKSQLQKLAILNRLEAKTVSLNILSKELALSKRKIKELVAVLREELEIADSLCAGTLVSDSDAVYFSTNFKSDLYIKLVNNLTMKYFKESSLFRILLYILEIREFSITSMSNSLSYSESYGYKLFAKLNMCIRHLNIGLKLTKKNDKNFHLVGDESTIRIFHYLIIAISSTGNYWLFRLVTKKKLLKMHTYIRSRRYENLSDVGKNKVDYILAIYELALRNDCRLINLDCEVIEIGTTIYRETEMNLYLNYLKAEVVDSDIHLNKELVHIAFIINYFTPELRSDLERQNLGELLSLLEKNTIVGQCTNILNAIKKRYHLSEKIYYLLLYLLCNHFVVIHHLGLYRLMKYNKKTHLKGDVELFVEKCIKNNLNLSKKEPSFEMVKFSFKHLIMDYLLLFIPRQKNIYVEFLINPELKPIIENTIRNNYSINSLQIVGNYQDCDIVISDTHGYENKEFFYFKNISSKNSLEDLGIYLSTVINQDIVNFNHSE